MYKICKLGQIVYHKFFKPFSINLYMEQNLVLFFFSVRLFQPFSMSHMSLGTEIEAGVQKITLLNLYFGSFFVEARLVWNRAIHSPLLN